MKNTKRILLSGFLGFVVLAVLAFSVAAIMHADQSEFAVIGAKNIIASVGDTVEIDIELSKVPSGGISELTLDIKYDDTMLRLVKAENNRSLGNGLFGEDLAALPYRMSWSSEWNRCPSIPIATLTFEVLSMPAADTAYIYITGVSCSDTDGVTYLVTAPDISIKNVVLGDVNGDGAVSLLDVTRLRKYIAGGWDVSVDFDAADVTGDGNVTQLDVTRLRKYIAGGWGAVLCGKAKELPYAGYNFKFLNSDSVFYMYNFIAPEDTGDVLDTASAVRNWSLKKDLGATVSVDTQPFGEIGEYAKNIILAEEDKYDAMYIPLNQLTPMVKENLFYDLNGVEGLDITGKGWHRNIIEAASVGDEVYFATNDINLMSYESAWCLYINEAMAKELELDMPYELVKQGAWTADRLYMYSASAANLNGDDSFTLNVDGNATYGLAHMGTPSYMSYAMGAEYVSKGTDGKYAFTAARNNQLNSIWEMLARMYNGRNGVAVQGTSYDMNPDGYYGLFAANRALFLQAELKGAALLRECDGLTFGILPQPKYSTSQADYLTNIISACPAFCIPTTNKELKRTGDIVTYLVEKSNETVVPRYVETRLDTESTNNEIISENLKMIGSSFSVDMAAVYGWTKELMDTLNNNALKGNSAVSMAINTYEKLVNSRINETYAQE